jgi:hypothetical protein
MQEKTADISIQNGGGCRKDIKKGVYTIGDAHEMLPFGNTMLTMQLTGTQVIAALEDGLDNAIKPDGSSGAYPYAAGLRFEVDASKAKGSRITNVEVNPRLAGAWAAIDTAKTYTVVTNNYIAGGKDGYTTFGAAGGKVDTFTNYAQSFMDYLQTTNKSVIAALPDAEFSTQKFKSSAGCDHACNGTCGGLKCTIAACPAAVTAAPSDTKFYIKFTATMPYSKADFDDAKKNKYKAAVAAAAATIADNVDIVNITEKAAARRASHGGASIEIETKVRANDEAGMTALSKALGTGDDLKTKLNKELKAQGLAEATAFTDPAIAGAEGATLGGAGFRASVSWAVLVAASALVLGLVA